MNLPTLSVILPNYNHARFLPTCLRAIFTQSVPPTEVIVIDDASTDQSLEVLADFARQYPSLRVFRNERNQGVVYNLNRGLELARGEWLTFPAADDEIAPGLFEKSLRLLAQHPRAALCCAIAEWRETFSGLVWQMAARMADRPCYLSPEEMVRLGRKERLFIVSSSCIHRKEALLRAGGFPAELRWHADWYACYVTGFRDGICYVPEVLSLANLLPGSFFQSGSKRAEHRQVLLHLLARLSAPACADVRPRIRDSGVLSVFSLPLLRLVIRHPEYRYFFNATLVRRTLRRSAELTAKRVLPTWLARWCLHAFYRHKPARTAARAD